LRLLVVEDDPDLNRQLVAALSDAGYAVDTAFDGEEGHFLGYTEPYDAVVLDLGLPKKDGSACSSNGGATNAICQCSFSPHASGGAIRSLA
jgi:DNA-binding response OmpR family regulator